jgi:hypothetical protein
VQMTAWVNQNNRGEQKCMHVEIISWIKESPPTLVAYNAWCLDPPQRAPLGATTHPWSRWLDPITHGQHWWLDLLACGQIHHCARPFTALAPLSWELALVTRSACSWLEMPPAHAPLALVTVSARLWPDPPCARPSAALEPLHQELTGD